MTTKRFLSQAYQLNALINSNLKELEQLRMLSERVSSANLSGMSPGTMTTEAAYASCINKIVDLEKIITDEIDRFVDLKKEIRSTIDTVDKPKLKVLLQERYLNFKTWRQIQEILKISDIRYVYRLHNASLKKIKKYHCITTMCV